MKNVFSVGLGGMLGSLARYFIYVPLNVNSLFPWSTLTVNLLGSFFLAFFLTVALKHFYQRASLVLAISTGFTGAFTTFSSVSVEVVKLNSLHAGMGFIYIVISFTLGLLLALAGRYLGIAISSIIDKKSEVQEAGSAE